MNAVSHRTVHDAAREGAALHDRVVEAVERGGSQLEAVLTDRQADPGLGAPEARAVTARVSQRMREAGSDRTLQGFASNVAVTAAWAALAARARARLVEPDPGVHRTALTTRPPATVSGPEGELLAFYGLRGVGSVITFCTTIFGTMHIAGWLLDLSGVCMAPGAHHQLRIALAVVFAALTTGVIWWVKGRADRRLLEEGRNLGSAIWAVLRDDLPGRRVVWLRVPVVVVVATLLGADVYTNFTGGAAWIYAAHDRELQLTDPLARLDARIAAVAGQLDGLTQRLAGVAEEAADGVLAAEAGGESYTGLRGEGPNFHAKRLLLTESAASRTYLRSSGIRVAGPLLRVVLDTPMVGDGRGMVAEVEVLAGAAEADARALLTAIQEERAALDPREEIEVLQAHLDAITLSIPGRPSLLERLDRRVNDRLQGDVNDLLGGYNQAFVRLGEVASTVGHHHVEPGQIETITLPEVAIDGTPIRIEPLLFKEATELARGIWDGFPRPVALTILFLSLLGAFVVSYPEYVVFLGPRDLRRLHRRDAEAAAEMAEWAADVEAAVVQVVAEVLDEGGASWLCHRPVDVKAVGQAVSARREGVAEEACSEAARAPVWMRTWEAWTRTEAARSTARQPRIVRESFAGQAGVEDVLRRLVTAMVGMDVAQPYPPALGPDRFLDADEVARRMDAALDRRAGPGLAARIRGFRATALPAWPTDTDLASRHAERSRLLEELTLRADGPLSEDVLRWTGELEEGADAVVRGAAAAEAMALEEGRRRLGAMDTEAAGVVVPEGPWTDAAGQAAALDQAEQALVARKLELGGLSLPSGLDGERAAVAERIAHRIEAVRAARGHRRQTLERSRLEEERVARQRAELNASRLTRWYTARPQVDVEARPARALHLMRSLGVYEGAGVAHEVSELDRGRLFRAMEDVASLVRDRLSERADVILDALAADLGGVR